MLAIVRKGGDGSLMGKRDVILDVMFKVISALTIRNITLNAR